MISKAEYWENIVEQYHWKTKISCDDFHYGPLIVGDSVLKLLPNNLKSLNCLELACGGAQNSIYLAKNGANCTALDASEAQISYAKKLAEENAVKIDLKILTMEEMTPDMGVFDLIHSSYGLNFSSDLNSVIRSCSKLLKKNGALLFSVPHPLFSGEFLEIEDESGLFIGEYFEIPPDLRFDRNGNETARSHFYSLEYMSTILSENDFLIERICEPQVCENPPYTSDLWDEYREQMLHSPGTIIIKAVKR
jgi:SAM-dependent methyltransferase